MIWLLATRGIATRRIFSPHTETPVEGAHSLVYSPGVEPIRYAGVEPPQGPLGTFGRGLHRASGFVFSHDGDAADRLLGIDYDINLIVYYTGSGNRRRKRTFTWVVFVGDATVQVPPLNEGLSELIGVPFRVNIPHDETLADHIIDEVDG